MKTACVTILTITQLLLIHFGCDSERTNPHTIKYIDREITINGILNDEEWACSDSIIGLYSPWDSMKKDETIFKSFHSDHFFNFCFEVKDRTIVTYDFTEEHTIASEDRVELFFSHTNNMSDYFCIEIDPLGRVLDYSAQFYRTFNEAWDLNQATISSLLTPEGFIIEGCISLKELERLGITGSFYLGIFRADFKSDKADDVVWYTWNIPASDIPDFHIPSALSKCIFENPRK